MPREKGEERLDNSIRVLVSTAFKADYDAYCDAIGENESQHIRKTWEAEVEQWKAAEKS